MPTDSSLIALQNVSKIYTSGGSPVYAVRDVTIEIQPGEFFSLLGSSGSGKTTTLRLIGGFEIPEYGEVYIGGEAVTTLPPYRRDVHTVFQSYALFPHLNVAENIAYPLQIARTPREEIGPRLQESLRMFRLDGLSDRRPAQLSGGQQQRVALARALISRPKVLLLDEPLSALDAKIREEVRQELRELQRQTGLTFVYVTHDQEEALALSDRLAVMSNGQIEQIGTPQEIYNCPASTFVAQFIGKANFLSGVVQQVAGPQLTVDVNGVMIQAITPSPSPAEGDSVSVMIRPERLRYNGSGDNQVAATGVSATYVGQFLQLQLQTPVGLLTVVQLASGESLSLQTGVVGWAAADSVVLAAA